MLYLYIRDSLTLQLARTAAGPRCRVPVRVVPHKLRILDVLCGYHRPGVAVVELLRLMRWIQVQF